jgi:hypothetical protein
MIFTALRTRGFLGTETMELYARYRLYVLGGSSRIRVNDRSAILLYGRSAFTQWGSAPPRRCVPQHYLPEYSLLLGAVTVTG